jgi:hypothetical protein
VKSLWEGCFSNCGGQDLAFVADEGYLYFMLSWGYSGDVYWFFDGYFAYG